MMTRFCGAAGAVLFAGVAFAETVTISPQARYGTVKPMNGVNNGPIVVRANRGGYGNSDTFAAAKIPFVRTHDSAFEARYGGDHTVDIHRIFPNFEADENDPQSYDFACTDNYLKEIREAGAEVFYRLGTTIEHGVKKYGSVPPKDFAKWARICEHVIRHYNEGWADGFKWNIRYWEIWNEPDEGKTCWGGTTEQFFDLFETAAKHLKGCFPHLKIGGYASSGLFKLVQEKPRPHDDYTKQCVDDFFRYVKEHKCPLDFFSIHAYDMPGAPLGYATMRAYAEFARKTLDDAGFTKTELSMNEWLPRWSKPGSDEQAARVAEVLVSLQDSPIDTAMIYDGKCGTGIYSPLFDPITELPRKAYWAMTAFNELYQLKGAVKVETADGLRAAAACEQEDYGAVMVVNPTVRTVPLRLDIGNGYVRWCRLTDATHDNAEVRLPEAMPPWSFVLVMTQGGRCKVK